MFLRAVGLVGSRGALGSVTRQDNLVWCFVSLFVGVILFESQTQALLHKRTTLTQPSSPSVHSSANHTRRLGLRLRNTHRHTLVPEVAPPFCAIALFSMSSAGVRAIEVRARARSGRAFASQHALYRHTLDM